MRCCLTQQNRTKNFGQTMRVVVFISGFFFLFILVQRVMIPQWNYPQTVENTTRTISDIYRQKQDSVEVVFLGPSTSVSGISPLKLYNDEHIISYNFATSGQDIFISYYLLEELIKYQAPKVVVLEICPNMFGSIPSLNNVAWRQVMDSMPFSSNKLEFAKAYMEYCENPDDLVSIIFPICKYHSRWKELEPDDFRNKDILYCNYGFKMSSQISPSLNTVEEMNSLAKEMELDSIESTYINNQGTISYEENENSLYDVNIDQIRIDYLKRIKDLCENNDIELLTFSMPANNLPSINSRAWTVQRYNAVKETTAAIDIKYIDLLYDVQLQYDWGKDTQDGGAHVNILGAEKTTAFLGRYLKENYLLTEGYDIQREYDKKVYSKVREVARLQMESDFTYYIEEMSKQDKNKVFFVVGKDEWTNGISEFEQNIFQKIGLRTDIKNNYRSSYIAIIENGNAVFEKCSNRETETEYYLENEDKVELMSCGFLCGSDCSIKINEKEYALKNRGLNIVVYDKETQQVIDTVSFDTSMEEHVVNRDATNKEEELRSYELYWENNPLTTVNRSY